MKVLVTIDAFKGFENLFKDYDLDFTFKFNKVVRLEDARDADILLGCVPLEFLDEMKNLKYVHWGMAGSDTVAKKLKERNIPLTNSTGTFSLSIAEYMITMILYFYKNIYKYAKNQEKHLFHNEGENRSIYGSKVLVIGCGSIGMAFAKKMHDLGAEVSGVKRTISEKPDFLKELYTTDKLDEILGNYDIVTMSMPQNDGTIKLMNNDRLSKLKDGAVLVNVGRGTAIDTESLIEELKKKRIFAALDVYEKEPVEGDSPLWDLENLLMLPHIAGDNSLAYTRELLRKLAISNLDAFLNNKELKNIVDFETGYKVSNS